MEEILNLTPQELYKYVKNTIKYGFVDENSNKYYPEDFLSLDIDNLYILQSPNQVLENKCSWCWDLVELYRYYFDLNNIINKTFYIEYKNDELNFHHTHTFILYFENNKWYNIEENSSCNLTGIFEYTTEYDAFRIITNSFKIYVKDKLNIKDLENHYLLLQYLRPKYGISAEEFQNWCKKR